ncbi:MAG: MotA/TolQ/ExbB proton channel family protein [Gammaproteobacteria bacterium]|nr:MotA/TolQ/ExbB proton channel family protein [Gammaproteobacteria bacterium]
MNVYNLLTDAGWPIIPLILCSIVAMTVLFERMFYLRKKIIFPNRKLEEYLTDCASHLPDKTTLTEKWLSTTVLGKSLLNLVIHCVTHAPFDRQSLRFQLEQSIRDTNTFLEKYLTLLATIASVSPLLGLLGTVVGMIEIFAASTPGTTQPAQLAHGISVALYNTAYGLGVAIFALLAWRYFRTKADKFQMDCELACNRLYSELLKYAVPSMPEDHALTHLP